MTAFDKTRPKPEWLVKPPREGTTGLGHAYYNRIWNAQPPWQEPGPIRAIYRTCKRMRTAGHDVHVDHIMPLQNKGFCGLHVPWNLRVVDAKENIRKSNSSWPGQPFKQINLFYQYEAPDDFELEVQNGF